MSLNSVSSRANRGLRIYALVFMVVLYAPVLLIPIFSFNNSTYIAFPLKGFTLDWYDALWGLTPMWEAFWNSVKVGIVSAILSTTLGVFAAKAITRHRIPGKRPIVGFMMLPLVVPGIIFAVALLILMTRLGVPLSLLTVTFGHLLICIPFSIATLIPRFEGFDASIEEASADLGENAWWTFWRVTFPLVLPGIVASLMLTFTVSFDEFIMAFFLTGTDQTLPMFIWGQLRFPDKLPPVLALSTIIIGVSFVLVFISLRLSKLGLTDSGGAGDG